MSKISLGARCREFEFPHSDHKIKTVDATGFLPVASTVSGLFGQNFTDDSYRCQPSLPPNR